MKKIIIFIDTNIYLRFYDQDLTQYKSLIPVLGEIKDYLFITEQIKNEILRNKTLLSVKFFNDKLRKIKEIKLRDLAIPKEYQPNHSRGIDDHNEKVKNLEHQFIEVQRNSIKTINKIVQEISQNEDLIYKNLLPILTKVRIPEQKHITRSLQRKRVGNPPGKHTDPIGDELNWEQLIDSINEYDELWIVSKDTDFLPKMGDNLFLNSYLHQELIAIKDNIVIKLYDNLSGMLINFKKEKPDLQLPRNIKIIKKEEGSYELLQCPYCGIAKCKRLINEPSVYLCLQCGHEIGDNDIRFYN